MNIKNNLISFLDEFRAVCTKAGRKTEDVRILYAVKYLNPQEFVEFIKTAKELRMDPVIVGENRVQVTKEKMDYVRENHPQYLADFRMMMIGPLQSNKINKAIDLFEEIHSIDSLDLAGDLDQRLKEKDKKTPVYLEVNVSGETTKHGFKLEQIESIILTMKQFGNLTVKGLMTMAPNTDNTNEIRSVFKKLKEQANRLHLFTSMGMSHDWKIAIDEGSDMVRIGLRIFS